MPSIPANGFKTLVIFALLLAALGGVWFGLFSCGGYVWHHQLMHWTLGALAVALLLFPPRRAASLSRRAALALAVVGTFFVFHALAAPFYPAFPSFGDYFRQVGLALATGPC
jgi:multisubunit Na+/H+ antiporter MnhB subunit